MKYFTFDNPYGEYMRGLPDLSHVKAYKGNEFLKKGFETPPSKEKRKAINKKKRKK